MVSPGPTGYLGKFVAQIGQREIEARRQLDGFRDGLGNVGEQLLHPLRRFQIALGIARQQLARRHHGGLVADRGEHVEQFAFLRSGWRTPLVASSGNLHGSRQFDHGLIARFLIAMEMALQFGVNVVAPEQAD